ncbi:hypothetical protein ACFL3C_02200 [Patescibacteria group bacterium]
MKKFLIILLVLVIGAGLAYFLLMNNSPQEPAIEDPQYLSYSESLYSDLIGNNKPFTLFFYDSNDEALKTLRQSLKDDIENYPIGSKIIEVDFGVDTEIQNQYEVTEAGVFISINSKGKVIETFSSVDVEEIKTAVSSSL